MAQTVEFLCENPECDRIITAEVPDGEHWTSGNCPRCGHEYKFELDDES